MPSPMTDTSRWRDSSFSRSAATFAWRRLFSRRQLPLASMAALVFHAVFTPSFTREEGRERGRESKRERDVN
jgi:hypothetical protein